MASTRRLDQTSLEAIMHDPVAAFDGDVKLRAFALPEMLRTPLEEVCLRARYLGLAPHGRGGIERFLSKCPSPPGPLSLHNAIEALGPSDMFLLDEDRGADPNGRSGCLDTSASSIWTRSHACRSPRLRGGSSDCVRSSLGKEPFLLRRWTKKSTLTRQSVHLQKMCPPICMPQCKHTLSGNSANLQETDVWDFCRVNFISRQAMLNARANKRQLSRDLVASKREIFKSSDMVAKSKRVDDPKFHVWQQWGRVMGVLAAAFGSQLARLDHGGSGKCRCPIYTRSHGRVKLFPSSVSSPEGAARDSKLREETTYYIHRWGIYMEKVRNTGGIMLYDINEVSPFSIAVCVSGERRYSAQENDCDLLKIGRHDGKVIWSQEEVDAMVSRREILKSPGVVTRRRPIVLTTVSSVKILTRG